MTKDVLVRMRGTQVIGEETETIEVIVPGSCYEKNGKWYLIYDENIEGADEPTRNTVKIGPEKVEVTKHGLVNSHLVYETGKKNMANYMTPMGLIVLGITTKSIFVEGDGAKLRLELTYALEMNGQFVSDSRLEIEAASKQDSVLNLAEQD
ncbi:MAG: DUF1934 domain-containing protein [Lachnospiraceae bacterium]|nr:DUF1934 domain-containing protein [Lachnospiraceae bacterium]